MATISCGVSAIYFPRFNDGLALRIAFQHAVEFIRRYAPWPFGFIAAVASVPAVNGGREFPKAGAVELVD
jgi:hypothetical protein